MAYSPNYSNLYVLRDAPSNRPFRGMFVNQDDWVFVKHYSGTKIPSQIICTQPASPRLYHEKIIEKFVSEGISGWDVFEVDVLGKDDELFTGYFGLSIKGRCSPVDFSRSLIVNRDFPGGSFPYLKGRFFEDDYWDGSDIFMEDTGGAGGFQYCSERVKKLLVEEKVKSIKFERLIDFEIDVNIIRSVSPEKLPKGIELTK
ncbi:hypothetical protein [Paenibacillus wynnii]|uniref:hypothetical protein n=1 Tax=Paenibacillus wynnii TaxID=268407 RepID=UPI002792FA38|nr:hypothetical protein [Paenibacillus wynnii]MDQ0192782.1 hypothetical protein [Paenibacillus wynnii]